MDMGALSLSALAITEPGVDATAFRDVMRQLAGSVTVISTESDGKLHGFTATAVCSVCADPPTILIVVNRSARTHPHIDRKGAFAVNVLAGNQRSVAEHFAGKNEDQFSNVKYEIGKNGVPLLTGAAAHLECEIKGQYDIGTHTVFVGRLVGTGVKPYNPLIYHDAKYGLVAHM